MSTSLTIPMTARKNSSAEFEFAAISALMKGADISKLTAQHFVDPVAGRLFAAAQRLRERGEQIDALVLFREVNRSASGRDEIPLPEIHDIDARVPTSASFGTIVAELNSHLLVRARQRFSQGVMEWSPERLRTGLDALLELAAGGEHARLRGLLEARRFDAESAPPKSWPIYRLGKATIATPGNLVVIASQAKAGKSAFVGALIAASTGLLGDTLGVTSENAKEHAVIHLDTEQSRFDHHMLVQTALRRVQGKAPPWLRSYCLVDLNVDDRLLALEEELRAARLAHGRIHSVIIDGIADLVRDPNDPEEAFALVARLHALAVKYETVIVCVLHFNPGAEGKTRGHLGSQLERKAETNLHLEKSDSGITTVYATKARHAMIPKTDGPRFRWSEEDEMHVSVSDLRTERQAEHAAELRQLVEQAFGDGSQLRYGELLSRIKQVATCSERTAQARITELRRHKLIEKDAAGHYRAPP